MSHLVMPADPLGRAMLDCQLGGLRGELVYRDGDDIEVHEVAATYFTPPADWTDDWRRRLTALDGPVVDVGCGPGQHAHWLQDRGREVVAIDASPHAVDAAHRRGVEDARVMDMFDLDFSRGRFESAIVIGTQLGLAGSLPGVRSFLAELAAVMTPGAVAVVDSYDPAQLDPDSFLGFRPDPRAGIARRAFHFEYHPVDGEREIGRSLSFVLLGPDRLREAVVGTPWTVGAIWPQDTYYRAKLVS